VIRKAGILPLLLVAACASTPAPAPPAAAPADEIETGPAATAGAAPTPEPAAETASATPDRSRTRITIAAVGDMMLGTDYPEDHLPDDDGVGFLADVAPILASADIAFGNLEGVLLDGGEPGKKCSNPDACYLFRSPSRYVEHYRNAGFDVMSLANNHARDFGEEGRLASMRTLAAAGILHSGLEGDFASLSVNGLKVAVMAYAVTRNSNLLLDYDLARATVAGYAGNHDIVIVSFHGGAEGRDVSNLPFGEEEYFGEPRGDVVRFSRLMVDAGADLVIGHGPHVVRAMENYKGRLIAYSLGNFATYYGISVAGIRGIAPILEVTLDGDGNFVEGRIHSTRQIRPAGPSIDPENRALIMLRGLSREDFGSPGIVFLDDGTMQPAPRQSVRPLTNTY
jgi:poly-gamma-glutamate capsule biosynthesis protein CapA/YwtB (metallophosphatase superfamily)